MNSTRSSNNSTYPEKDEEPTSVVQLAELVLIGICVGLIFICTIFYIITRVMRRKHQKQFRKMEEAARNPLKEATPETGSNHFFRDL
ncbi:hypothetical protein PMAYCL1PPCAC_30753 [Pristionchus mayeri]|uniref:Uncharacterized protein n=1 Tax=Pristionchus mayeri TaxID=1317129 RepID=A0AAN5DBK4_9BILA|nr:hypothetical protein PMAYCL1PPCAC_30753 [Pristionchus mayeri]